MISSEDAVDTMREAYEMGITDYISRPFDSVIVKKRVQNTLSLYANQKHLINAVYDQVYEKEENNNIMIRILSNILGSRNSESSEHILHIRTVTEILLRKLIQLLLIELLVNGIILSENALRPEYTSIIKTISICIVLVFILANVISWIMDYTSAQKLTRELAEFQAKNQENAV